MLLRQLRNLLIAAALAINVIPPCINIYGYSVRPRLGVIPSLQYYGFAHIHKPVVRGVGPTLAA